MLDGCGGMMDLLGTVSASDEIGQAIWQGAHICFVLAMVSAAVSVWLLFWPSERDYRKHGCTLSLIAVVLGLLNLAFEIHVYRIDFVAVAWDGTPASPPMLEALALPALPLLLALVSACGWFFRPVRAFY